MKTWLLMLALMAFFLATFGVVTALEITPLNDPKMWMTQPGWPAATLGMGLLIADVLIPAPASLVMMYHGALFGLVGGTLLSLVGGLGASLLGFGLGRKAQQWVPRLVRDDEHGRAHAFLARWGGLAIVVTRPVPVFAETMVIVAGTTAMSWRQLLASSLLGLLPTTALYAWAGATAAGLSGHTPVFLVVVGTAGLVWLAGSRFVSALSPEGT